MPKWIERWLAAISSVFAIFGWSVSLSALVAITVGLSTSLLQWVQQPSIYVPAMAFLFVLWTYVGLAALWNRKHPQPVRIAHEYAYSVISEPTQLALANTGPAHDPAFLVVYNFRNVGAGPLRLRMADFRIVIDGMTNDDPPANMEITVARMAVKGFRTVVKRAKGKGLYEGTAMVKLLYGPPDEASVRRYTLRVKVVINADEAKETVTYTDEIVEERDTPYAGD